MSETGLQAVGTDRPRCLPRDDEEASRRPIQLESA